MTVSNTVNQLLIRGLAELEQDVHVESLMEYLTILDKWNQAYNLTAVRDVKIMVSRHILDSVAILPWLDGTRIIDVGTGAGLPGIPLAIALPEKQFVLLDSNGKKIRFLKEVVRQLKLSNVDLIEERVENYRPQSKFDVVTSRAFSELSQMLHWTEHLMNPHGLWLAMKGKYPGAEMQKLEKALTVHSYNVPGMDEERCCVVIKN